MVQGDLDEIVDAPRFLPAVATPLLNHFRPDSDRFMPVCLRMSIHYYNWKCRGVGAGEVWARSVLYPVRWMLHPTGTRTKAAVAHQGHIRTDGDYEKLPSAGHALPVGCLPDFQYTKELVGWHASYFFDATGIENKLRSFWHAHDPATKVGIESVCFWSVLRLTVYIALHPSRI